MSQRLFRLVSFLVILALLICLILAILGRSGQGPLVGLFGSSNLTQSAQATIVEASRTPEILISPTPSPRTKTPTIAPTQTVTEIVWPTETPMPTNTPKPTVTEVPTALAIETRVWKKDRMEQVYVAAGEFLHGCVKGNNNGIPCPSTEPPSATIYLDAFFIDKYEVTNAQYAACVTVGNCKLPLSSSSWTRNSYYGNPTYANYPVIWVEWKQAKAYCVWAGKRLPTEAEWEKAARGTDGRPFPWGNAAPTCSLTNHYFHGSKWLHCVGDTSAVGSYPDGASPYGALDMAGNVEEWVSDWYDSSFSISPSSNPTGPTNGTDRIFRGGTWSSSAFEIRVTYRDHMQTTGAKGVLGFRCAVSE